MELSEVEEKEFQTIKRGLRPSKDPDMINLERALQQHRRLYVKGLTRNQTMRIYYRFHRMIHMRTLKDGSGRQLFWLDEPENS